VGKRIRIECDDVNGAIVQYRDELGFRIDTVFPADAPRTATLSGYGLSLHLGRAGAAADATGNVPPNRPTLLVSPPGPDGFAAGRAGMQYRDLIPGRYGGRFIASHIRIPDGGPVPDYVHHHDVRFQFIYCVNGWVDVLYENQGPAMRMHAGDCFLQPPHIRHRVLECSDAMEVVEMACPAEHVTCVEHEMSLPTGRIDPNREFNGQRFVFGRGEQTPWTGAGQPGFELRDTGIEEATSGLLSVTTLRAAGGAQFELGHDGEIRFVYVRNGKATLIAGGDAYRLDPGAACAIPPGLACSLERVSPEFNALQAFVPAAG